MAPLLQLMMPMVPLLKMLMVLPLLQMMPMVPLLEMSMVFLLQLMMPMVPPKDLLIMMTMVQMFLLMHMLLPKPQHLLMSKQDVPVLVVDLAALVVPLLSRILVMDAPRILAAPTGDPLQEDRHLELDVLSKHPGSPLLQGGSLKNKDVAVD